MMKRTNIFWNIFTWTVMGIFVPSSGLWFNQPIFSDCVDWNQDGIALAMNDTIGDDLNVVFVDRENVVYVAARSLDQILIWSNHTNPEPQIIIENITKPCSLFVANNRDVYIGSNDSVGLVIKYSLGTNTSSIIMETNGTCYSLFIDANRMIYCSLTDFHQVIKFPSINSSNASSPIVIAGNGMNGSLSTMLSSPQGIFVNSNSTLYIADSYNHRIQRFLMNETNGTTVLGNGANRSPSLSYPTAILIDGNGYLFVADYQNQRILRVGPHDYWCIIGCSSLSHESVAPWSFNMDRNGNLYVHDSKNASLTKFSRAANSCQVSYNRPVLCPDASWKSINSSTFANATTVGTQPQRIFIDSKNNVYVAAASLNTIAIWHSGNSKNTITISSNMTEVNSVFVTRSNDLYYASHNNTHTLIHKRVNNSNDTVLLFVLKNACTSIVLDFYDNIYCALADLHQIIRLSPMDNSMKIVAGNGTAGSASNQLNYPRGIFLTSNMNLYVADCENNRVQLFSYGEVDGITVLSNSNTVNLSCPNALILDGYGYMYVSDRNNSRILRVVQNIVDCIIGCGIGNSSGSNDLNQPHDLRVDSLGNIYVSDRDNNRIQRFLVTNNTCGVANNRPQFSSCPTWSSTTNTFLNETILRPSPGVLFVDRINQVYVVASNRQVIEVWDGKNSTLIGTLNKTMTNMTNVFVTFNGNIYYDTNNGSHYQINKWVNSTDTITPILFNTGSICAHIFIDFYNQIYCSLNNSHQIVLRSPGDSITKTTSIAGNGTAGSTSFQLNNPQGIFVTYRLDLYVADCGNNRIQHFLSYENDASTIPTNPFFNLSCPNSVVLDADGNLFVSDRDNRRILRISVANNYQCIVGCTNIMVQLGNHHLGPAESLNFDSFGNLFFLDGSNNRILKLFSTANSPCPSTTTTTVTTTIRTNVSTSVRSTQKSYTSLTSSHYRNIILLTPCDILQPCYNNGTCMNTNHNRLGYVCTCPIGFNGSECQFDQRLCRSTTCRNGGTCQIISNTSFICDCPSAWEGTHCEWRRRYCQNVTCLNEGVCRLLLNGYKCECLSDAYTGDHCEKTSNQMIMYAYLSKSFAFVAITVIVSVGLFIILLDILKYGFGVDLKETRQGSRRKRSTKRRRMVLAIHYKYVHQ